MNLLLSLSPRIYYKLIHFEKNEVFETGNLNWQSKKYFLSHPILDDLKKYRIQNDSTL